MRNIKTKTRIFRAGENSSLTKIKSIISNDFLSTEEEAELYSQISESDIFDAFCNNEKLITSDLLTFQKLVNKQIISPFIFQKIFLTKLNDISSNMMKKYEENLKQKKQLIVPIENDLLIEFILNTEQFKPILNKKTDSLIQKSFYFQSENLNLFEIYHKTTSAISRKAFSLSDSLGKEGTIIEAFEYDNIKLITSLETLDKIQISLKMKEYKLSNGNKIDIPLVLMKTLNISKSQDQRKALTFLLKNSDLTTKDWQNFICYIFDESVLKMNGPISIADTILDTKELTLFINSETPNFISNLINTNFAHAFRWIVHENEQQPIDSNGIFSLKELKTKKTPNAALLKWLKYGISTDNLSLTEIDDLKQNLLSDFLSSLSHKNLILETGIFNENLITPALKGKINLFFDFIKKHPLDKYDFQFVFDLLSRQESFHSEEEKQTSINGFNFDQFQFLLNHFLTYNNNKDLKFGLSFFITNKINKFNHKFIDNFCQKIVNNPNFNNLDPKAYLKIINHYGKRINVII